MDNIFLVSALACLIVAVVRGGLMHLQSKSLMLMRTDLALRTSTALRAHDYRVKVKRHADRPLASSSVAQKTYYKG